MKRANTSLHIEVSWIVDSLVARIRRSRNRSYAAGGDAVILADSVLAQIWSATSPIGTNPNCGKETLMLSGMAGKKTTWFFSLSRLLATLATRKRLESASCRDFKTAEREI